MTSEFHRKPTERARARLHSLLRALPLALCALAAGCQSSSDESAAKQPARSSSASATAKEKSKSAESAAKRKLIKTEEVTYHSGDVTLKGYLAYDSALDQPRPGILVVHEWWGHNEYARGRARALAGLGYTALAVDMYGDGKQAKHPDDAKKFSSAVMSNLDEATKRFQAAKTLLEEHPSTNPEQISAIGYCFGGGVVLAMARRGLDLDGVASFHGMLGTKTPAEKGSIKAKLLVQTGGADPFVPPEQVEAFKKEMAQAGADLKFVSYPGAKHAFTVPGADAKGKEFNLPLAYDASAATKSWHELEVFLAKLYPARG